MDAHKSATTKLMKNRDIRAISLNINRLEPTQLASQLRARGLSTRGDIHIQQDRLLPASILEADLMNQDVPWDPDDEMSETQTTEPSERAETSDEEIQKPKKSKTKKGKKRRIPPPVIVEERTDASTEVEEIRSETENVTTRTANFSTAATTSLTYTTANATASLSMLPTPGGSAAGGRFEVEPSLRRHIQVAPELQKYLRNDIWNLSTLGIQLFYASSSPRMNARVQPSPVERVTSSQPTPAAALPPTTQVPPVSRDNSAPSTSQRQTLQKNKTTPTSVHRALYEDRSTSSEEMSEPEEEVARKDKMNRLAESFAKLSAAKGQQNVREKRRDSKAQSNNQTPRRVKETQPKRLTMTEDESQSVESERREEERRPRRDESKRQAQHNSKSKHNESQSEEKNAHVHRDKTHAERRTSRYVCREDGHANSREKKRETISSSESESKSSRRKERRSDTKRDRRSTSPRPQERVRDQKGSDRRRRRYEGYSSSNDDLSESEYVSASRASSEESEDERSIRGHRRSADQGLRCMKILQSWKLSFSGEDKDGPEEFLAQLDDCRRSTGMADRDILLALPCVLTKGASRWYRTVKDEIESWREFKRAFRHQFIGDIDQEDLQDELHQRTQTKGEKIVNFLSCFKYIVGHFKRPPPQRKLVEITRRNLLPEYRKAMADKLIVSLADIERYGRMWEKQKDLDNRYAPPSPKEKMRIPGAAYQGSSKAAKVAATEEVEGSGAASGSEREKKKKTKRGGNKTEAQKKEEEVAEVKTSPKQQQPTDATTTNTAAGSKGAQTPPPSYSAVVSRDVTRQGAGRCVERGEEFLEVEISTEGRRRVDNIVCIRIVISRSRPCSS